MKNQSQARELITICGKRVSLEPIEHHFVQSLKGFHPFRIRSKRTDKFFETVKVVKISRLPDCHRLRLSHLSFSWLFHFNPLVSDEVMAQSK
jgi:hypothetical protein